MRHVKRPKVGLAKVYGSLERSVEKGITCDFHAVKVGFVLLVIKLCPYLEIVGDTYLTEEH